MYFIIFRSKLSMKTLFSYYEVTLKEVIMFLDEFECGYVNRPYCSLRPFSNTPICPIFSCPKPNLCHPPHPFQPRFPEFFPPQSQFPKFSQDCFHHPYCCMPDCFPVNPPFNPCPPSCNPCPPFPCPPSCNHPPCNPCRPPCNPCPPRCNPLSSFVWFYGGLRCGKKTKNTTLSQNV